MRFAIASFKWAVQVSPYLWVGLLGLPCFAQESELHACLPDSNVCSETEAVPLSDYCGNTFFLYQGRVSWPALRAVGPITVSVQTYGPEGTYFPLYVQILPFATTSQCTTSGTSGGGILLLETRGLGQCGGLWETIGPIETIPFGISPGDLYRIRILFIQPTPNSGGHSPALGCVSVTTETPRAIAHKSWGQVKQIYK
jgi:hypothetical protein